MSCPGSRSRWRMCFRRLPQVLRRIVLQWLPLLLWMGVVLGVGSSGALPLTGGDLLRWLVRKGIHVGEYAVLGWLFYRALAQGAGRFRPEFALLALLLTAGFGAFDEWRQNFIPGRSGRGLDVGIDTLGGGVGQLFAWTLSRVRQRAAIMTPEHPPAGSENR